MLPQTTKSFEEAIRRVEARSVDYLTALAHQVIIQSDTIYCMNSDHWDSDNQENHDTQEDCIYYPLIHQIVQRLAKGI
jgi:hypothetical protein